MTTDDSQETPVTDTPQTETRDEAPGRRVLSVHGVRGTIVELAHIGCGHCLHYLSWHVTLDDGVTQCSFCHCLRLPGEDITKPHNFVTREAQR